MTRFAGGSESSATVEEITVTFQAPDRMVGKVVEQVNGQTVLTTDLRLRKLPGT